MTYNRFPFWLHMTLILFAAMVFTLSIILGMLLARLCI